MAAPYSFAHYLPILPDMSPIWKVVDTIVYLERTNCCIPTVMQLKTWLERLVDHVKDDLNEKEVVEGAEV